MRITIPGNDYSALLALLICAAILTGCASGLSKEECEVVNWQSIGYEDGLKGLPQDRVGKHRKDCAEHGVALNLSAYRTGWREGVATYCRPGNGYRLGRDGVDYYGVCPPHLEDAFIDAYGSGRRLYNLEQEVRRLSHKLGRTRRHLDRLETEIRDTGLELVAPDVATSQRVVLLDELRRLETEHSELRDHVIPDLEYRLANLRSDLADMRAAHR